MRYFLKKPWTEELIDLEGYNRWISKNPEYSYVTWDMFNRYWKILSKEVSTEICRNTHGFELPLYMGTISMKKMDREFKCEKDLPQTPCYNPELGAMEIKPFPNIENKVARIYWKKNRRFRTIAGLFGLEFKSQFTKWVHANIKTGNINVFQMEPNSFQYPSKCESTDLVQEKHPFDLV